MNKNKRLYKTVELTPAQQTFVEVYSQSDNATKSIMVAYPHITDPNSAGVKGSRLLRNDKIMSAIEAQKAELEAISTRAVQRIGELVDSESDKVSLGAAKFAIEQVHGKAVQKMELKSQHVVLTLDLSGGEAGEPPQEVLDELANLGLVEPQ